MTCLQCFLLNNAQTTQNPTQDEKVTGKFVKYKYSECSLQMKRLISSWNYSQLNIRGKTFINVSLYLYYQFYRDPRKSLARNGKIPCSNKPSRSKKVFRVCDILVFLVGSSILDLIGFLLMFFTIFIVTLWICNSEKVSTELCICSFYQKWRLIIILFLLFLIIFKRLIDILLNFFLLKNIRNKFMSVTLRFWNILIQAIKYNNHMTEHTCLGWLKCKYFIYIFEAIFFADNQIFQSAPNLALDYCNQLKTIQHSKSY